MAGVLVVAVVAVVDVVAVVEADEAAALDLALLSASVAEDGASARGDRRAAGLAPSLVVVAAVVLADGVDDLESLSAVQFKSTRQREGGRRMTKHNAQVHQPQRADALQRYRVVRKCE